MYTTDDFGTGASLWEAAYDQPLPSEMSGESPFIPLPPLDVFPDAPKFDPFDTPAMSDGGSVAPGFGMGAAAPLFSERSFVDQVKAWEQPADVFDEHAPISPLAGEDDMENTYGILTDADLVRVFGPGSLGEESWIESLAKGAGQMLLNYQQARLEKRAAEKGLSPLGLQLVTFGQATPVPAEPAPVSAVQTDPIGPPVAPPIRWGTVALVGGGLALAFLLMGRRRR